MNSNLSYILKNYLNDSFSIYIKKYSFVNSFLFGVGIYTAINIEKSYTEIPICIFFPTAYIGYKSFKYNDILYDKVKNIIK